LTINSESRTAHLEETQIKTTLNQLEKQRYYEQQTRDATGWTAREPESP